MALTNTEILDGIGGAFDDPTAWARAMLRLALTDAIAEKQGEIEQGRETIGQRDIAEARWLEARRAELTELQAQLTALASVPTVPTDPEA